MVTFLDIETGGLNAMEEGISCICIKREDGGIITMCGDDEKKILEDFWGCVKDNECFCGYNIKSFDIPYLIKRSLIHNVKMKKVNINNLIDLMLLVNGFYLSYDKKQWTKLDDWCFILGCTNKVENGLKMVEYFKNKQFDKIREHCEYDILLTELLWRRCYETNLL